MRSSQFKGYQRNSRWMIRLVFRYLRVRKSSRFLSFLSGLSFFGISLGVFAAILILSIMGGFERELKNRLFQTGPHLQVEPQDRLPFSPSQFDINVRPKIEETLLRVDPAAHRGYVLKTFVLVKSVFRSAGAELVGLDPELWKSFQKQVVEKNSAVDPKESMAGTAGLLIGQELAYELGVIPGESITLVSGTSYRQGLLSKVPLMKSYVVNGIYKTDVPEQELHTLYLPLHQLESFLRHRDQATSFEIHLSSPSFLDIQLPQVAGFQVQTWRQLHAHLFSSLTLERMGMFLVLAMVLLISSFNIFSFLSLHIYEKKKSFFILRALGAQRGSFSKMIQGQAFLFGILGALLGTILGCLGCWVLARYPLLELPAVYYDRTVPIDLRVSTVIFIDALALVLSWGLSLPASSEAEKLSERLRS